MDAPDDILVALAFELDAARHRLLLRPRGIDGLTGVTVGFGAAPDQETPRPSEGWPGVLAIPLPAEGLRAASVARLGLLMDGQPPRRTRLPLARLRTPERPTLILSRLDWDGERAALRLDGWLLGPPGARLVLARDGEEVAEADLAQPRPDVSRVRPLLSPRPGWTIRAALDLARPGRRPRLELRLLAGGDATVLGLLPIDGARLAEALGAGAPVGPLPRLRARAAVMPRARIERLIASEPFRRRWQDGSAACALAREALADELARRVGPGEEIRVRLVDGDLVHCRPVDDSQLARRYLLFGHDELGFTRWVAAQVRPGEAAFDAGSAYGIMARAMARRGARVVAIEADALAADRIRRAGLEFGEGRIELVEAAVAAEEGWVTFAGMGANAVGIGKVLADDGEAAVGAFLREIADLDHVPLSRLRKGVKEHRDLGLGDVSVRRVPAVTMDGLCARFGLAGVRLVKIDVEGGELEALRGAKGLLDGAFGPPPLVAFEYSDLFPTRGGRREEVLDQFLGRGWTLWRFEGGKNGGGGLSPVAGAADAPKHDNLVAIPPGAAARDA